MAELLRHGAAIGEAAAFGQVYRVRWIAWDQNAFLAGPFHSVDGGHRGEQRLRIGMARRCEQTHAVCMLNDPAHIHHRDAVTHVLHHAEIMADKQIGQAKVFLRDCEGASWVIQTVGQRFEAQRSQKLDPAGLVCIGRSGALDTAALEALFGLAG